MAPGNGAPGGAGAAPRKHLDIVSAVIARVRSCSQLLGFAVNNRQASKPRLGSGRPWRAFATWLAQVQISILARAFSALTAGRSLKSEL
jgi:hypothetical protein